MAEDSGYFDPLSSHYDVDPAYAALVERPSYCYNTGYDQMGSPAPAQAPANGPDALVSKNKDSGVYYFNATFQRLLRDKDSTEKFLGLQQLIREFVEVAETYALDSQLSLVAVMRYGRVIISERTKDVEDRTIKPITGGVLGIAGGDKYICAGVLFKFASDVQINDRWIYGGTDRDDELAMKSVNHELRGIISILQSGVYMNVPLLAVINHNGYRLAAVSILPIDKASLRYGSSSAGKSVLVDPEVGRTMQSVGEALNLKGHYVNSADRTEPPFIYGPADLEVHAGKDGHFYMLDFARLWPTEAPSDRLATKSGLAWRLRPELVRSHPEPLSSDAYSGFEHLRSRTESNAEVSRATERLHSEIIPTFGQRLDENPPDTPKQLFDAIHQEGINCRHLGQVLLATKSKQARAVIYEEMSARVVKQKLRFEFRQLTLSEAIKSLAAQTIQLLLSGGNDSHKWWQETLPQLILEKFGVVEEDLAIRQTLDLSRFVLRLASMLGLELSERCVDALKTHGVYSFGVLDLVQVNPTVKHVNIVDYAEGMAYYFLAKSKSTNEEKCELLEMSQHKLEAALLAAPFDTTAAFRLGVTLATLAKHTKDSIRARRILDEAVKRLHNVEGSAGHLYLVKALFYGAKRFAGDSFLPRTAHLLNLTEPTDPIFDLFSHNAIAKQAKLATLVPTLQAKLQGSLVRIDLSSRAVVDESLELIESLLTSAELVSRIKVADLKGCSYVTDGLLMPFFAHSKLLEECNLQYCQEISDQCLEVLAKNCKLLRKLDLSHCENITDMGFEAVAGGCPKLVHVNLEASGCSKESVMALLALNSNVQFLKFGAPPRTSLSSTASASTGLNDSELAEIAANGSSLTHVTIIGSRSTASGLKKLFFACPRIESLSIRHAANLSVAVLSEFLTSASIGAQMTRLDFRFCDVLGWAVLPIVAEACPNLRYLALLSQTHSPSPSQASSLAKLSELRQVKLRAKEPLPLFVLFATARLRRLEKISLVLQDLDTDTFRLCVRSWPELVDLRLTVGKFDTQPIDWAELGRMCPKLSKLYFDTLDNLTDACLVELAQSATNLTEFSMPAASLLSELSFVPLLKNNANLRYFNVNGSKLTGAGFVEMAKAMPHCEWLYLKTSAGVSNEFLAEATTYFNRLTRLELGEPRSLLLPAASRVLLNCPFLKESIVPSKSGWIMSFMAGKESIQSLTQQPATDKGYAHTFMLVSVKQSSKKFLLEGVLLLANATLVDGELKRRLLSAAAKKLQHFYAIDPKARSFLSLEDIQNFLPELICIGSECPPLRAVLAAQIGESLKLSSNAQVTTAHLGKFHLEKLRRIALHSCIALDERGLFDLADKVSLESFEALHTPAVSLAVLSKVLQRSASRLRRLVVQHCFTSDSDEIYSSPLLALFKSATGLTEVRLSGCWHWDLLHHMCTSMPQLVILDIPEFVCIDLPLGLDPPALPHGRHSGAATATADLSGDDFAHVHSQEPLDLTTAEPIQWFEGYETLQELALGAVTNEMLARLAVNSPKLSALTLSNARNEDLRMLPLMNKVNLKTLKLGRSVVIDAEHWPYESHASLVHFALSHVELTEIEIETIIRSSAHTLQTLDLATGVKSVGAAVGRALETSRHLRSLKIFFAAGVENESIANFLQTNQSLESLTIGGSALRMSMHDPLIKYGGHLRSLELLPCTSANSWSFVVSDFDLIAFSSSFSNLQSLALPVAHATDFGLEALAKLTNLHGLKLASSTVRDSGIITFVTQVPGLVSLDFSSCAKLTDTAVVELAKRQTRLQSLALRECPLLTDASVEALVSHAKALSEVDMSFCPNISPSAELRLRSGLAFQGPKKIIFAQTPATSRSSDHTDTPSAQGSDSEIQSEQCRWTSPRPVTLRRSLRSSAQNKPSLAATTAAVGQNVPLYICADCAGQSVCFYCIQHCHEGHNITRHSDDHTPKTTTCQCGESNHGKPAPAVPESPTEEEIADDQSLDTSLLPDIGSLTSGSILPDLGLGEEAEHPSPSMRLPAAEDEDWDAEEDDVSSVAPTKGPDDENRPQSPVTTPPIEAEAPIVESQPATKDSSPAGATLPTEPANLAPENDGAPPSPQTPAAELAPTSTEAQAGLALQGEANSPASPVAIAEPIAVALPTSATHLAVVEDEILPEEVPVPLHRPRDLSIPADAPAYASPMEASILGDYHPFEVSPMEASILGDYHPFEGSPMEASVLGAVVAVAPGTADQTGPDVEAKEDQLPSAPGEVDESPSTSEEPTQFGSVQQLPVDSSSTPPLEVGPALAPIDTQAQEVDSSQTTLLEGEEPQPSTALPSAELDSSLLMEEESAGPSSATARGEDHLDAAQLEQAPVGAATADATVTGPSDESESDGSSLATPPQAEDQQRLDAAQLERAPAATVTGPPDESQPKSESADSLPANNGTRTTVFDDWVI